MIDYQPRSHIATYNKQKVTKIAKNREKARGIYPEWVDTSKWHFFTFFLLNFIQSLWLGWTGTSCRLFCSEGGVSLSESEDEGACVRFCENWGAEGSTGWIKGESFVCSTFSSFSYFSSSSELKESMSSMGGGSHGFQLFELDLLFLFFSLSRKVAHEFCRCPVWWQWRHRKAMFS